LFDWLYFRFIFGNTQVPVAILTDTIRCFPQSLYGNAKH